MREIKLGVFGIVLTAEPGAGSITSDMRQPEMHNCCRETSCGCEDCRNEVLTANYNSGIDAIESMVLAHACAGIDVEDPKYLEGIETAVQALANNT
jgi:hypothetical protein